MEPIIIKVDPEITLKLHDVDYSEILFNLIDQNREYLREWLPWVDNTKSIQDSKTYIEGTLESYKNTGNFDLGIWYKQSLRSDDLKQSLRPDGLKQQLVGCIGIHDLKKASRQAALGYWLAEDFTGEGIMTRSVKALIHYLFVHMQLHRIEIRAGIQNEKSCAIPKRLGFKFEGILRDAEWLYDHYHDLNLYSMLVSEWR